MKITAIVPAAGAGKRLQAGSVYNRPKQFWPLGSNLIIEKILLELEHSPFIKEIILVCSRPYKSFCRNKVVKKNNLKKVAKIIIGGRKRADSVYHGLKNVSRSTTHVLVHDGVRPFLTQELITRLVHSLDKADGIIVARSIVPTLKKVKGNIIIHTVDRDTICEAETPQLFKKDILKKAFTWYKTKRKEFTPLEKAPQKKGRRVDSLTEFTDEASLVEAIGGRIKVLKHDGINLKVTTPADYKIAKRIVEGTMVRVGMGYDIHRLVAGRDLIIGGIKIPFDKGCLGHSDGDPLLHAITDALLGAASLGDIGEYFPDTDPKYKNIPSSFIVSKAMRLISKCNLSLLHIDATIIVQKPKLQKYKDRIRKKVAHILGLTPSQVNIKAKTKEELESEGSGFSISAYAIVTLIKN